MNAALKPIKNANIVFVCQVELERLTPCGSTYWRKGNLACHIEPKRITCSLCSRTYVSNKSLNEHVKNFHNKQTAYKCEYCGKGFTNRLSYTDHVAYHSGIKRHACARCGKQYTLHSSLRKHVCRIHSDTDTPL